MTILSKDTSIIEEIAILLLNQKMIIKANIDWDRNRYVNENGVVVKQKVHILTCISKSLLFTDIAEMLEEKYKIDPPEIYSTAIVNMDWNLAKLLTEKLKKA